MEGNLPLSLCFTLYLTAIYKNKPGGEGLYLEGLIHGGAYFRNFTVFRPIGCKKKLWALFLPRVHFEKQQTRRKFATFYSCWIIQTWINIVVLLNVSFNGIIFLSWLFVKISFLSLFRLWFSVIKRYLFFVFCFFCSALLNISISEHLVPSWSLVDENSYALLFPKWNLVH